LRADEDLPLGRAEHDRNKVEPKREEKQKGIRASEMLGHHTRIKRARTEKQ